MRAGAIGAFAARAFAHILQMTCEDGPVGQKILIIDDDPQIREVLQIALERDGYQVAWAAEAQTALAKLGQQQPNLIVLDIGLPGMDGLELCQKIRARADIPILFLSARADEVDRVLGLELGADDYVTKPFSPRELLARIKVILRRSTPQAYSAALRVGALELNTGAKTCRFNGADVPLTPSELAILSRAMERPDIIVSRLELTNLLYSDNPNASHRTVDSHLRNLRRKLSEAGCPDAIEPRHGQGIRLGPCEA